MRYFKYLLIGLGTVVGAYIGLIVGYGLMTFLGLTYILLIDGMILISIISAFAFGGFRIIKMVVKI